MYLYTSVGVSNENIIIIIIASREAFPIHFSHLYVV